MLLSKLPVELPFSWAQLGAKYRDRNRHGSVNNILLVEYTQTVVLPATINEARFHLSRMNRSLNSGSITNNKVIPWSLPVN